VGTDGYTRLKVLDRNLKRATRKGRFWPVCRGSQSFGGGVRLHANTRTAGPEQFLKTYRGYLQADAYVAYDSCSPIPGRGLVEIACWAHTRRHFHRHWIPIRRVWARCARLHRAFVQGGKTCAAVRHPG